MYIKGLEMEKLLNETMDIALKHFNQFGFENEQVVSLLTSGKRDLTKELGKLQKLLENEPIDVDAINLSLHALKGLFLTMGNTIVADKLNELRQENDNTCVVSEIKVLLGL